MRVGVRNIKNNKRNSSFIREMRVFTYYYLILSCKLNNIVASMPTSRPGCFFRKVKISIVCALLGYFYAHFTQLVAIPDFIKNIKSYDNLLFGISLQFRCLFPKQA